MRRIPGRGLAADSVAVLGSFLVLGAIGGVLWWLLVEPALYTKAPGGGAMDELELAKRFAADGWYAVIAIVAGFTGGVGLTWWRSRDYRATTLLLVPGAALAAAAMTSVGNRLGPQDPEGALTDASRGDTVPVELVVTAFQVHLMWPIAVLVGALMVLWSSPGVPPLPRARQVPPEEIDDRPLPDPEDSARDGGGGRPGQPDQVGG